MMMRKIGAALLVYLVLLCLSPGTVAHAADGVAPPAADETLIYVIRPKRFTGGAVGYWIAVNDETVARVRHKKHAIIRTKAGLISLNLAIQGNVVAAIAVDDRPGEIVYLKYRLGDENIVEIGESEAQEFLRKSKPMDPIDEIRPNNEKNRVLMNVSRLGFDMMQPAGGRLEPDDQSAVITLFRRREKVPLEFGVWSSDGFVGTLGDSQGLELRVPAGRHLFGAAQTNTAVIDAEVEAGKHYYVWLDYGKMMATMRLTPVTRNEQKDLNKWLADVEWLELNSDSVNPRVKQREEIIVQHMQSLMEKLTTGEIEFSTLDGNHAY